MHIVPAKKGEVVQIGNVRLFIRRLRRDGNVEIGVEAPKEIPIHREEYQQNVLPFHQVNKITFKQDSEVKRRHKQRIWIEIITERS